MYSSLTRWTFAAGKKSVKTNGIRGTNWSTWGIRREGKTVFLGADLTRGFVAALWSQTVVWALFMKTCAHKH